MSRASLVAQRLKRLPALWETWVRSLGQEEPLEKEMATHSSILAWRIPWTEEPGGLQSMGSQRVGHDGATSLTFTFAVCTGERETLRERERSKEREDGWGMTCVSVDRERKPDLTASCWLGAQRNRWFSLCLYLHSFQVAP